MTLSSIPWLVGKAALASTAAYLIALELVPKDTLSATFVAMLCISPTIYTGLRLGVSQLVASALGGLATLAVTIPLGPGAGSLALSMILGISAAFILGFARTYAVAGFTVLYVSLLGKGSPEAYLIRLASVLLGIGIGALTNLVVSAFAYRRIFGRRLSIAARAVQRPVQALAVAVRERDPDKLRAADLALGPVFTLLGDLEGEFHDLRRELRLRRGWRGEGVRTLVRQDRAVGRLQLICHFARNLSLALRELYLEPGGADDSEALGVPDALDQLQRALDACASRLAGIETPIPTGLRKRYDPMLRRVAARIAEGHPESIRLELALSILVDLDNLFAATSRVLELAVEIDEG